MRILIFGINYAPELTGIGKYTGEMAAWLAKKGNQVSVVTALPYYPEWNIHPEYKGKWWTKEFLNNVTLYRCPLYVPKQVTPVERIIHEFSFLLAILPVWIGILFQKKYDVVICVSPPFHLGILPMLYSKLRGSKIVTHVQDLQVDAAKDLGMIKNQTVLDIMFRLENIILNNSSAVSTISPGMMDKIISKGIAPSKMLLFPNWVDENEIKPLSAEHSLREEFGIGKEIKVILYSGNLGEKQGLEIIVDVAEAFRKRDDVLFLIVGSGGGKDNLIRLVNDAGLPNIKFLPLQPYEKLSALLATADLHLVMQKKSASDLVMPSKLTAILAAGGCPIVTASKGTSLYEVISQHQMGIIVEPESAIELKNGIETALASDLTPYRTNAREYSELFLSKENILTHLEFSLANML
jgi:colanic acid biosynthesis glycosyl transferase WcaI